MSFALFDGVDDLYGENSVNNINYIPTYGNNPNNWEKTKHGYYNEHEHT